jgi:hypothetical protein
MGRGMNTLPRTDEAVIPLEKILNYALSFSNDKNKAIAFEKALGYNVNNADMLISNVKNNLKQYPAKAKGNKGFGERYEVVLYLTGVNGKQAKVITGWIDDASTGEMRLTTIYVDKRKGE